MGEDGAHAIQGLLQSVSEPAKSTGAALFGLATLIIGATTVFAELQGDLDRIWRAPERAKSSGLWSFIRARLLSFGLILGIAFLLMVSLVLSAAVAALGKWWGPLFTGWEVTLQTVNFIVSFGLTTVLFAMIYKLMPRVRLMARRLGRSFGYCISLRYRQTAHRAIYRQERHRLRLWCRGIAGDDSGLGLLFSADFFVRRRIHVGLCPPGKAPSAIRRLSSPPPTPTAAARITIGACRTYVMHAAGLATCARCLPLPYPIRSQSTRASCFARHGPNSAKHLSPTSCRFMGFAPNRRPLWRDGVAYGRFAA